MRRKDGTHAAVTYMTIRRVDIKASEAPILIRGGSHNLLIEDARLTCTGKTNGIPGGIKIGTLAGGGQHHITINRVVISGCVSKHRPGYMQGDGISTERPDRHTTIRDAVITDAGNGLLDLKSSETLLDRVALARGDYALRAWAQGHATALTARDIRKPDIQMKPTTNWTIDRWHNANLGAPYDIVAKGAGGRLRIGGCDAPVKMRIAHGSTVSLVQRCIR